MTEAPNPDTPTRLVLNFCGERVILPPHEPFVIGRDADLAIDDNPYLHRHFLEIRRIEQMWWVSNVGSQLAATISDGNGLLQAWLAPGARMPVLFECTVIRFSAGPTFYELELALDEPTFSGPPQSDLDLANTTTTLGRVVLTAEQHLMVLALAEPSLREQRAVPSAIPTSAEAAQRLGWQLTKFNRKLDNVCGKLEKAGVRGLHGEPGHLAASRRARLVEYALAVRLVVADDLSQLDRVTHE
jgi:hypothetical protein